MRIEFIDGEKVSKAGLNYTVYINAGKTNQIYGCYTHKTEKGITYYRRYFEETDQELKGDTIYVVRQENKKEQCKTLIHELCHWANSKIGNWKKIHELIDEYLR